MGKSIDKATKHLWKGRWLDTFYALEKCPLCGEMWTFRFYGKHSYVWECKACDKSGGLQELLGELTELNKYVPEMEGIFDEIISPEEPEGLLVLSQHKPRINTNCMATGFSTIDRLTGGLEEGMLTILTGEQRHGKSTFAGQLALNAVQDGIGVCFYSGELNADMFQRWIYGQAAGAQWMNDYTDRFGVTRYRVDDYAATRISAWLGNKFILHDNTYIKSSEGNAVIKSFVTARRHYDCKLFFADNLMTMKNDAATESGYWREQSKIVGSLVDFAMQERVHVILVAHPKKEKTDDLNKNVAGVQEVTQRSSFVMTVERITPKLKELLLSKGEIVNRETTNVVHISKNRVWGDEGHLELAFEPKSKRLIELPDQKETHYGWEELIQ